MFLYVLSDLFFRLYCEIKGEENKKILENSIDVKKLEEALNNFLNLTMGYKLNYLDNMKEVELAFENIISANVNPLDILVDIKKYEEKYIDILNSNSYVKIFLEAVNSMYSPSFNIKNDSVFNQNNINIAIKNIDKYFEIIREMRIDEDSLPTILIHNIDDFEQILINYINSIKHSDSFYNIFNVFGEKSEKEIIKVIFEATLLNLSTLDALNVEKFFKNYTNFINDSTFNNLKSPRYMGNIFEDELYVMLKRSEILYETPYYFAFMLKDKFIELPNVRFGISIENGIKVANIIATQSSQRHESLISLDTIQKEIKSYLPKDSYYRFFNPTHLVSLVLTFGIFKGMDINKVVVKDYLPFRYKKVIMDKQLNEEEAYYYQTRLTTKNLITYMRIISNMEDLNIIQYPDIDTELTLSIGDNVKSQNEFLTNIYSMGLEIGKKYKIKNEENLNLGNKKL